jgi:HD-GYP domain-containing protein (c-di-GMP phosphodiesterase class II)
VQEFELRYPVHTLENQVLFLPGGLISAETLEAKYSSEEFTPVSKYCLLKYGSTEEDLFYFLNQPPYNNIFRDRESIVRLLHTMDRIDLVFPFLQSLDYFKKHDSYTYHHILMVFALSMLIAKDLIPDYQDRLQEIATGPTHDFGKICVPLHVLKKTTPLTKAERNILKHHSMAGYALLSYYYRDTMNPAAVVARDHHERRNGSGYPRGIPLRDFIVEIIAACDVYDALISPRPYRPVSYDNRTALEVITGMAERKELGWEVVKALVAHNRGTNHRFDDIRVSTEKRGSSPPGNMHGVISEDYVDIS